MKIALALILFPFRMSVGIFWMLWSILDWGIYPGWLFPGHAPLFHCNDDQLVFYLKRQGWRQFAVMKYNLRLKHSEVLHISKVPFHTIEIRGKELALGAYIKGNTCYTMIDLNKPDPYPATQIVFPDITYKNRLMPKTIGFLSAHVVCADDECFTEFLVVTTDGSTLIGPRHPGRVSKDPCLSFDEKLLIFSDQENVYAYDLQTGKQIVFPMGKHVVSNWSLNNVLLICDLQRNHLVLADLNNQEEVKIEVSRSGGRLQNGVVSPSGQFVCYWTISEVLEDAQGVNLNVYSVEENRHSNLGRWAMILDARWSVNEKLLSIAGVKRRDLFELEHGRKMRNAYTHDKEIISIDGQLIASCQ